MEVSLWSSKECSFLRPCRPSSVGLQCGNSKNFPADHNNDCSDPVQIRMTILHFYTPTFQATIFCAKLWLVYIKKKNFTSNIDQNLFREITKFSA